jgi:hypothetical protein
MILSPTNNSPLDLVMMTRMLRMTGMPFPVNLRIEPAVLIRRVLHSENGTVRFVQRVLSLDHIPISTLRVRLDIPSVMILDSILELILRVALKQPGQTQSHFHPLTHIVFFVVILLMILRHLIVMNCLQRDWSHRDGVTHEWRCLDAVTCVSSQTPKSETVSQTGVSSVVADVRAGVTVQVLPPDAHPQNGDTQNLQSHFTSTANNL